MAKLQGLFFALVTLTLVAVSTFYFTKDWLPPLKSNRGDIDSAIAATLVVTGAVFILTNLLLAYFGWRFQDAPGARSAYWHDNPRLEWTWTLVTAAILGTFLYGALGVWAGVTSKAPDGALLVEVTGQQFAWNVRYPGPDGILGRTKLQLVSQENPIGRDMTDPNSTDDRMLLNEIYLPQDRPVRVRIRSMDVIHSFFLPSFRVKQDAVPGLNIDTWFIPKESGDFEIACAEHCGLGHYRMRGALHVVPADQFEATLRQATE